jgi:hypothetical protein
MLYTWWQVACGACSGHYSECRQQKAWFLLAALMLVADITAVVTSKSVIFAGRAAARSGHHSIAASETWVCWLLGA